MSEQWLASLRGKLMKWARDYRGSHSDREIETAVDEVELSVIRRAKPIRDETLRQRLRQCLFRATDKVRLPADMTHQMWCDLDTKKNLRIEQTTVKDRSRCHQYSRHMKPTEQVQIVADNYQFSELTVSRCFIDHLGSMYDTSKKDDSNKMQKPMSRLFGSRAAAAMVKAISLGFENVLDVDHDDAELLHGVYRVLWHSLMLRINKVYLMPRERMTSVPYEESDGDLDGDSTAQLLTRKTVEPFEIAIAREMLSELSDAEHALLTLKTSENVAIDELCAILAIDEKQYREHMLEIISKFSKYRDTEVPRSP